MPPMPPPVMFRGGRPVPMDTPQFSLPQAPPLPPVQPAAPIMRTYDPPPQIPQIPMPDISGLMNMNAPPQNLMEGIGYALRQAPMMFGNQNAMQMQNQRMAQELAIKTAQIRALSELANIRDKNMMIYGDMNKAQSAAQVDQEHARQYRSGVDLDRYEAENKAQDTLAGASQKMAGAYENTQQGDLYGARTQTENALRDPRVSSEKAQAYQRNQAGNLYGERSTTEQQLRTPRVTAQTELGNQRKAGAELNADKMKNPDKYKKGSGGKPGGPKLPGGASSMVKDLTKLEQQRATAQAQIDDESDDYFVDEDKIAKTKRDIEQMDAQIVRYKRMLGEDGAPVRAADEEAEAAADLTATEQKAVQIMVEKHGYDQAEAERRVLKQRK